MPWNDHLPGEDAAHPRNAIVARFRALVASGHHGVIAVPRDASTAPFSHTVGLPTLLGWPELLVQGFDQQTAEVVLNGMVRRIRAGLTRGMALKSIRLMRVMRGHPVRIRALSLQAAARLPMSAAVLECKDFEVWQVLVPDAEGRLPGDPGCAISWSARQRVPDVV